MGFFDGKNNAKELYVDDGQGNTVLATDGQNLAEDSAENESLVSAAYAAMAQVNEMDGTYPLITRGALLRCTCGTHGRRFNIPKSHGTYYRGKPMTYEDDNKVGDEQHIRMFGVCTSDKQQMTEWGGLGQRLSGETILLQNESTTNEQGEVVEGEGNVRGLACRPAIIGMWKMPRAFTKISFNSPAFQKTDAPPKVPSDVDVSEKKHIEVDSSQTDAVLEGFDYYHVLDVHSFLVCKHGGIIVPTTTGQEYSDAEEEGNTNDNPDTGAPQEEGLDNRNPNDDPWKAEELAWEGILDGDGEITDEQAQRIIDFYGFEDRSLDDIKDRLTALKDLSQPNDLNNIIIADKQECIRQFFASFTLDGIMDGSFETTEEQVKDVMTAYGIYDYSEDDIQMRLDWIKELSFQNQYGRTVLESSSDRMKYFATSLDREFEGYSLRLGYHEARGDYRVDNGQGYYGLYQIGNESLYDLGYKDVQNNWTSKANDIGIYSNDDFLSDIQLQRKILVDYENRTWEIGLSEGVDEYIGTTIDGHYITKTGLIVAGHFGMTGLANHIKAGTLSEFSEGYGQKAVNYIDWMGDYDIEKILE